MAHDHDDHRRAKAKDRADLDNKRKGGEDGARAINPDGTLTAQRGPATAQGTVAATAQAKDGTAVLSGKEIGELEPPVANTVAGFDDYEERVVRFRTIGDMTCTGAVESYATTLDEVIQEVAAARVTERGTRSDDRRSEAAMEDRKREGYF